jgi:hypothetical protein
MKLRPLTPEKSISVEVFLWHIRVLLAYDSLVTQPVYAVMDTVSDIMEMQVDQILQACCQNGYKDG